MLNLLAKPVLGVVGSLVGKVVSNFGEKAGNEHEEMVERLKQAGSYVGQHRTWWDSLVDGINRLVRPCFTFGTIGLFVYAVYNPVGFSASMSALGIVPQPLWVILGTIVVFWFGEKKLSGLRKPKPPSAKEVDSIVRNVRKIKELENVHLPN